MQRSGQATLSFIVLVSGIVLQVAIAGSIVTYFFNASKFSERLDSRSLAAAQAGIRDAQVRITRDSSYAAGGTEEYSLDVGNDAALISVTRTTDNPTHTFQYAITSIGSAAGRLKQLVGVVLANQTTGLVEFRSLVEEPVQ